LYVDSYPNSSTHMVEFSSYKHIRLGQWNDPYIMVDGYTGPFDHGYGK